MRVLFKVNKSLKSTYHLNKKSSSDIDHVNVGCYVPIVVTTVHPNINLFLKQFMGPLFELVNLVVNFLRQ